MDSERTDSSPQAPEQHGPEQPRRTRERAFAPLSRRSFLGVAAACGLAAGAGRAGCAPKPDPDPTAPVSYTHLDVYKRQLQKGGGLLVFVDGVAQVGGCLL